MALGWKFSRAMKIPSRHQTALCCIYALHPYGVLQVVNDYIPNTHEIKSDTKDIKEISPQDWKRKRSSPPGRYVKFFGGELATLACHQSGPAANYEPSAMNWEQPLIQNLPETKSSTYLFAASGTDTQMQEASRTSIHTEGEGLEKGRLYQQRRHCPDVLERN
jgi:hypothetical protein